jgi:hypothetical protein
MGLTHKTDNEEAERRATTGPAQTPDYFSICDSVGDRAKRGLVTPIHTIGFWVARLCR